MNPMFLSSPYQSMGDGGSIMQFGPEQIQNTIYISTTHGNDKRKAFIKKKKKKLISLKTFRPELQQINAYHFCQEPIYMYPQSKQSNLFVHFICFSLFF